MNTQKLALSAMRMAAAQGFNPYNSAPKQGAAYAVLWRMRVASIKTRDTSDMYEWFTA
jgi:hypothetical protein